MRRRRKDANLCLTININKDIKVLGEHYFIEECTLSIFERHSLNLKKCLSNVLITGESNIDEMFKKCSTDQSFILKEITS